MLLITTTKWHHRKHTLVYTATIRKRAAVQLWALYYLERFGCSSTGMVSTPQTIDRRCLRDLAHLGN